MNPTFYKINVKEEAPEACSQVLNEPGANVVASFQVTLTNKYNLT